MYQRLFIGSKLVNLKEADSTNSYLKELINDHPKEIEGLVVATENQLSGRGQKGSVWESENGKNLTFSIYLKPNIQVQNQFLISKAISLGIIHYLEDLGLSTLKIKWPNDIYCEDQKIAGILIESTIKRNRVHGSVVGIGLNVNQSNFISENNPTSILKKLGNEIELKEGLNQLLFFIEKEYILLKSGEIERIKNNYLDNFYWLNENRNFKLNNETIQGIIRGVNSIGRLQIEINKELKSFDLKEVEFLN